MNPEDSSTVDAVPTGWLRAGSAPADYDVGTAVLAGTEQRTAYLRARGEPAGFGTLMQTFDAAAGRGTRQKLSARVRSHDVRDWAGLWMRVDGPDGTVLAFDNMRSRPISGTTDWQRHQVVLDVAKDAVAIAFGILLSGAGTVWLDGVELGETTDDVTADPPASRLPDRPTNLDFSR